MGAGCLFPWLFLRASDVAMSDYFLICSQVLFCEALMLKRRS